MPLGFRTRTPLMLGISLRKLHSPRTQKQTTWNVLPNSHWLSDGLNEHSLLIFVTAFRDLVVMLLTHHTLHGFGTACNVQPDHRHNSQFFIHLD